jgi:hypothetical protein
MPNADISPVKQGQDNDDDLVVLGADIKKDEFLQLLRAVYPRYGKQLSPDWTKMQTFIDIL